MLKQFFGGKLGKRLWFRDDYFDLTVTLGAEDEVSTFEMRCDWMTYNPKHVRLDRNHAIECLSVGFGDDDEFGPKRALTLKKSPESASVLLDIAKQFQNRSGNMPERLADQIVQHLKQAT